ncbi:MAG TPA: hypothetical protein VGA79_10830 [Desulfobaccales bacterium]
MKTLGLIVVIMLVFSGCATFNHSETLEVDHFGATGSYSDSRSGALYEAALYGAGGAGGATVGLGAFGFCLRSNQSQSDPRNFARSVVMVDLSKKLKSIKVDDVEGIREYEYIQPLVKSEVKSKNLPSSFGHQPVE